MSWAAERGKVEFSLQMDAFLQHTEIRQLSCLNSLCISVKLQAYSNTTQHAPYATVERSFTWLEAVSPSDSQDMQLFTVTETPQRLSKYLKAHHTDIATPKTQTMAVHALLPSK